MSLYTSLVKIKLSITAGGVGAGDLDGQVKVTVHRRRGGLIVNRLHLKTEGGSQRAFWDIYASLILPWPLVPHPCGGARY